jgi:hypothetical protein
MPVWRLQTTFGGDSAFPEDGMTITPHFDDSGALTDPQGLCDDLADALQPYVSLTRQIVVKAYDAQGTVPVYPQGEAIRNLGTYPQSPGPRETAVCLSFYSTRNIPRQRGRLYIPTVITGISVATARPSAGMRTKIAALVPIFTNLGGSDVDWCVYSRTDDTPRPVTNWWVDDAWDTVRSRGLAATTRDEGTTTEG